MLSSPFIKELATTKLLAEKICIPIHDMLRDCMKLFRDMREEQLSMIKDIHGYAANYDKIEFFDQDLDKLNHLIDLLRFEYVLVAVDSVFPRLQRDVDDERDRFLIEKEGYRFRECFYRSVKKFLNISQELQFHDDRATRFLKDLGETMQNVIDFIDECRDNGEIDPR